MIPLYWVRGELCWTGKSPRLIWIIDSPSRSDTAISWAKSLIRHLRVPASPTAISHFPDICIEHEFVPLGRSTGAETIPKNGIKMFNNYTEWYFSSCRLDHVAISIHLLEEGEIGRGRLLAIHPYLPPNLSSQGDSTHWEECYNSQKWNEHSSYLPTLCRPSSDIELSPGNGQ